MGSGGNPLGQDLMDNIPYVSLPGGEQYSLAPSIRPMEGLTAGGGAGLRLGGMRASDDSSISDDGSIDNWSNRAMGGGDNPNSPISNRTLLTVGTGASDGTVEGLAKQTYGDQWRAGMALLVRDNKLQLNKWGSPIIQPGQTLTANDLSIYSDSGIASLSNAGGNLEANNSKGLVALAQWNAQQQQLQQQQNTLSVDEQAYATYMRMGGRNDEVAGPPTAYTTSAGAAASSPTLQALAGVGDALGSRAMGVISYVNDTLWQVGNIATGGLLAQYNSDAQAALVRQQMRGEAIVSSVTNLSINAGRLIVDPVGTGERAVDAVSNEFGKISSAYNSGNYRAAFNMAAGDIIDTALTVAPVIGPAARALDAAAEVGLQGASLAIGDFAASRTGQMVASSTEQYMARSGLLATAVPLESGTIGGLVDATGSIGNSEVQLSATQLRNTPGVATVSTELMPASGRWLDASLPTPIPAQVGDALAGQSFNTFGDLRQAIWEQVGSNPDLNSGFSRANLAKMSDGLAPSAPTDWLTETGAFGDVFNIHHANPIEFGGAVYDLSNLQIVSPKVHFDIHYGQN